MKTYAAIDIGSNAVRLLIKRADDKVCRQVPQLEKLLLLRVPLRLGFDVFSKGKISSEKEKNLLRLMKAYKHLMKIYEVDAYRACATSAMRDASNGPRIIQRIKKECSLKIEIIDGKEEAQIVFNNHLENAHDRSGNYLYVDVGGGSTELNFLCFGDLIMSQSFNIGTVRLLANKVHEKTWQALRDTCQALTSKFSNINIIGSGGNINKLYRMALQKDEEHKCMPIEELQRLYNEMAPMSVEQRITSLRLKPDRADVIIPAAHIFLTIASLVGAQYIMVPVIGVADGIIDGLYKESVCTDHSPQ